MNFCRTRSDVVRKWQSATPFLRSHRPFQILEQRLGVRPRDRQHRNLLERFRLGKWKPAGAFFRSPAWRKRIAGIDGHIHHAAALDAVFWPVRPLGIGVALEITIVARIGIDETTDGAALERHLWFHAAPTRAISR